MSGASNRSSNDSEWVILTPRGDGDSDGEEEPGVTRFGGTQNPRPATNPRPRPPRQRLSGSDSYSEHEADVWFSGPSGPPTPSEWRRESSNYGLPEYPTSASTAGPSASYWERASSDRPSLYEQRRRSSTHRIVDESRWYSTADPADFQQRMLVPQYRYAEDDRPYETASLTSDMASMAIVGQSQSPYYGSAADSRAPSLISSVSTRRDSRSAARTDTIGSIPNYYRLEADEDDERILRLPEPRRGTLQCPCSPLGCEEWFDSPVEWELHYQAHFRGRLPRTIECPFQGCDEIFQGERSRDAWRTRWSHMLSCRYRTSGVKPRLSRSLVDHLWRSGIISSAEEQQLRQTGTLSSDRTYLISTTDSRERRRERRPERRSGGEGGSGYYSSRR